MTASIAPVQEFGGAPSFEELGKRATEVVHKAILRGLSVGTAESCTGGLVSGALTSVPGSSEVVKGGVVSYAISVKHAVLGVQSAILDEPSLGAVSGQCATQMADGAARVLDADIAVSVTGIAGPGGEEPGKPVGTVWFGIHGPSGTRSELHTFSGNRSEVRRQAVWVALGLVCEELA